MCFMWINVLFSTIVGDYISVLNEKNVCVIIGSFDTFISASVKKAIGS